jgi:hypothetical protein
LKVPAPYCISTLGHGNIQLHFSARQWQFPAAARRLVLSLTALADGSTGS